MVQPLWKMVWQLHIKLNVHLPYDPVIPLLDIYLREIKTYVHTKTCTRMLISISFIKTITWKNPNPLQYVNGCGISIQWNGTPKNEWVIDINNNLDESQKHYAEWKKPVSRDYTLHDSINMTISKRQSRSNEGTWLPGTWGSDGSDSEGERVWGEFAWVMELLLSWSWWWVHEIYMIYNPQNCTPKKAPCNFTVISFQNASYDIIIIIIIINSYTD